MLKEEKGSFTCANGEVLLNFLAFVAAEGWIGQHHVVAVFFLNVGEVLGKRICVEDIWSFDAVQDQVHDRNDVGERLLLLAIECTLLKRSVLRDRAFWIGLLQVLI